MTGEVSLNRNEKNAADRVRLARDPKRPAAGDYIEQIFDDFIPMAGDRKHGDDGAVTGGIAFFHERPVTVIGHQKGRSLEENMTCRFGMPNPEGYRKAERLMRQAEKFGRPVITLIDTPGAYPGMEAEAGGQGEAIARCLSVMSELKVPSVAVCIGEGGSGGALAMAVSDRLIMLENGIFSILSPEGFASILWKDAARWEEAAEVMKLTAQDLYELGICDEVIPEKEGAHQNAAAVYRAVEKSLAANLSELSQLSPQALQKERYRRLRMIGKQKRKAEQTKDGRQ